MIWPGIHDLPPSDARTVVPGRAVTYHQPVKTRPVTDEDVFAFAPHLRPAPFDNGIRADEGEG